MTLGIPLIFYFCLFNNIQSYFTKTADPLIVTDYLNKNQPDVARELSRLKPLVDDIESYSGYFRVSDDCVRNMFFWYFPAENGNTSAPVVVWLQGGPGGSSMFGLFEELGPYSIDSNYKVNRRFQSWSREYNLIFFDNPVGTGFSFSDVECFLTNEDEVGMFLSICMDQFYQLFPNLKANSLIITGESYAGKYVPAMVFSIDQKNRESDDPINLKGMMIGNGFYAPYYMSDFGSQLFYLGLIFDNQIEKFDRYRDLIKEAIDAKDYKRAFQLYEVLIDGEMTPYPTLFNNVTGLENYYNIRTDRMFKTYYSKFLRDNSYKLNVGGIPFYEGDLVEEGFEIDFMKSMTATVEYIINSGYKTLFYTGQLDVMCGFYTMNQVLQNMLWVGKKEFDEADQKIWYSQTIPRRVNGFYRSYQNVMQLLVRNSGHMVPTDQPEVALEMLRNFVNDLPF